MRRFSPWQVIFFGLTLLLLGLVLGSYNVLAQEGEEAEADYVGASTCARCHRDLSRTHLASPHGLALQDVRGDKEAIKANFKSGEKERMVQFPGETTARPFTQDDIAYVVGAGRYVERYLYEVGRNKYAVFPAEWNVLTKTWQPYQRGETAPTNWAEDPAYDWVQNCAGCHVTSLNPRRGRWEDDGVQCEACHGPGSIHTELAEKVEGDPTDDDLKALRAAIVVSADAQICGQCHSFGTQPENQYPYPTSYRPGLNLLDPAIFTLAPNDSPDHWWATGHARQPNMQFNEWLRTSHATSLSTLQESKATDPACLTCHSADAAMVARLIEAHNAGTRKGEPPQPLTLQTAQFGVTCTACHNPHSDLTFEFNLVADSYALCTSCHRDTDVTQGQHHPVQEMFEGKQVVDAVEGIPSVHFTSPNGPKCQTCHVPRLPVEAATRGSHMFAPIQPVVSVEGLKDSCTTCHTDVAPDQMRKFIDDARQETQDRLKAALTALQSDSPAWVKTALDFVEGDGSYGIHNHRYTAALLSAVETQLGLLQTTRPAAPSDRPVTDPADCAQCHQQQHNQWLTSPHAQASLNDRFRQEFAGLRQPTYCMGCHASGYDARTGEYVFEGVVCSTCHYTENNAKHPPAPALIASDSVACGTCHSGAHAPTYDEWLLSAHNGARVDCVDCHTPHNNGLRQNDVNTTCGNCHEHALDDKVHMGDTMSCVDCHMKRQLDEQGVHVLKTGHSMSIDPSTCASCHGQTHLLSARSRTTSPQENQQIIALQSEVSRLEETARTNWATGIAGGAVGVLIVIGLGVIILRRGKLL